MLYPSAKVYPSSDNTTTIPTKRIVNLSDIKEQHYSSRIMITYYENDDE